MAASLTAAAQSYSGGNFGGGQLYRAAPTAEIPADIPVVTADAVSAAVTASAAAEYRSSGGNLATAVEIATAVDTVMVAAEDRGGGRGGNGGRR